MINAQRKMTGGNFMKLAVFCGAHYGKEKKYINLATEIGEYVAEKRLGLVYGGSFSGLMGAVSTGVLAKNGHVTGIYPRALFDDELPREEVSEFIYTETMDERKQLLINKSDAYLILPGGLGTLEELSQVLCSISIGLIPKKPIGILDIDGFYKPLVDFLVHAADEEFIDPETIKHVLVSADYKSLNDQISTQLAEMKEVA